MSNISKWERVWDITKFDDLYNRDERYFALLLKGLLSWLTNNIILYGKPIKHFIYTTGSSYMYVENNGYVYSSTETTGEDWMYMQMPRCIVELAGINIPTDELTSPYSNGNYERKDGDNIRGFYAQIRRIPIELDVNLKYVLSNFNESIILAEEIINNLIFQRYFNITFLGQIVRCSIEFPQNLNIEINRVDMTSPDTNQKTIQLSLKISSYYPSIDIETEIPTDKIITSFNFGNMNGFFLSLLDYNKTPIKVKLNKVDNDIQLVDINGNTIEDVIQTTDNDGNTIKTNNKFYDETGKELNKDQVINKLVALSSIPTESTLYFKDITNTVDIISKDNILK